MVRGGRVLSSKNGVFIIESLDLEDEEKGLFEGKILIGMLNMLGIKARYKYIRTKKELKVMIREFEESGFKYLHMSCHGDKKGIAMTLDDECFPFSELSKMFKNISDEKRLFLSSCNVMHKNNITKGMLDTQFLSITGPMKTIYFHDGAIFWSSFYHLMFSKSKYSMDNVNMKETIEKLSNIFDIQMSIIIIRKNRKDYNKYDMQENVLIKVN